jgi:hypothetical protein
MKKQITLVLVAWFICNLSVFAQDLPQIAAIGIAGRGVEGHNDFGHHQNLCAQESAGVFTWVGALRYNAGNGNPGGNGFKWYVGDVVPPTNSDVYQLIALEQQDKEVEDGGVYDVVYTNKANTPASGLLPVYTDYKWRLKQGEDGYYKITLDVSDLTAITMSVQKVTEGAAYANLGSLSVEGLTLVQEADESKGFDRDVYDYNCYIPANETAIKVSHFAFQRTKVKFNGNSVGNSLTSSITVFENDKSEIEVTGFDNTTTKTYTINYKLREVDLPLKRNLPDELQSSLDIAGANGTKNTYTVAFDPAGDYTVEVSSTVSNVTGRGMDIEARSGSGLGFRTSLSNNSLQWTAPFDRSREISATDGGQQVTRYAVKDNHAYIYLNGEYAGAFNLASIGDMDVAGTAEVPIPFIKSDNVYANVEMLDGVNLIENPDFRNDGYNTAPTGWVTNKNFASNSARVSGDNPQVEKYDVEKKALYVRFEPYADAYYSYAVTLKPDTWYEYSFDLIAWTDKVADVGCNFNFIVSKVQTGASDNIFLQDYTAPTELNTSERHVARFKTPSSGNATDTYYLVYKQKTDKKNIGITDLYLEEKFIGGLLFGKNYTDGSADIQIDYIRVDYSGAFAPGPENGTSVENIESAAANSTITIYSEGKQVIVRSDARIDDVAIYDIYGRCLLRQSCNEAEFSTSLLEGIYIIRLNTGGSYHIRKFAIR